MTTTTEGAISMTSSDWTRLFANAVMFTAKPERPILAQVRCDATTTELTVTATDSYALYRETVSVVSGFTGTFFIGRDDIAQMLKLAKVQKKGDVDMTVDGTNTTVTGEGWTLTAGSIFGVSDWPKTDSLWPAEFPGAIGAGVGIGLEQMVRLGKVTLPNGQSARDHGACFAFRFVDSLKPMVASWEGLKVLLMPCRLPASA